VRSLPLLALLLLVTSTADAQRVRVRSYGPSASEVRRSGPEDEGRRRSNDGDDTTRRGGSASPLGRGAITRSAPSRSRSVAESRNGRQLLARIPVQPGQGAEAARRTYAGTQVQSSDHRGHRFTSVVEGIKQRLRTFGGGGEGALRTKISRRAQSEHPALVTALRRFPDAVLVGRSRNGRGYVLQGPITENGRGQRRFLRIQVGSQGRTRTSLVDAETHREIRGTRRTISRRFRDAPAVVNRPRLPRQVYAISDVHGSVGNLGRLLSTHGVVRDRNTQRPRWTAGRATLVVVGDLINKNQGSLATIRYFRELQRQARQAGGDVIVTLGNHEAFFLANPNGGRSRGRPATEERPARYGINQELRREGILPEDVAAGRDAEGIGAWLRSLPVAARLGDVLFVHSGDTNSRSIAEIEQAGRTGIRRDGYRGDTMTGETSNRNAIVQSEHWETPARVEGNLRAAGVRNIVYGHNPESLGRTEPGGARSGFNGGLTNIDSALATSGTNGAMLSISTRGNRVTAHELRTDGQRSQLWQRNAAAEPAE